ncbi:BH2605 [Halalkalibacterium halodurans C-125]|uniref:BH2605 protein n=1 Tax=Halalkalibacterium halodurans (strain ATCC BAA-125 / DSM 18197 / FERM 7344 / JCM 9153 / C-125) TaxID=272558 RepID=Q9K9P0_HALH5|nr:CBS domain-containing protein [Halalkalibacterium halodurans]BAB06324.1 BH2605 [Halalkalibacterium halodurans C-125]
MGHIRDVMTTDVDYCSPDDNIFEVAVKMERDNVGAVPICEEEQLLGMVTDRDIVIRSVAKKKPNSTPVKEVMSEHLVTATPDMTVQEAAKLMATKQIRRLPVVENNRLVGICSLGDLAVRDSSDHQAGIALSEISEPSNVYH